MTVPCIVTVKEMQGDEGGLPVAHIRRTSGGEPTQVLPDLFKALPYTLPLPSYHAGSFACAIIAGWSVQGVPMLALASDHNGQGAVWRYEVTKAKNGKHLVVRVFRWCDGSTRKGVRQGWFEVFYGILRLAVLFADLIEEAGNAKPMEKINARTAEPSFWGVRAALSVEGVEVERDGSGFILCCEGARDQFASTLTDAFRFGRDMAKDRDAQKNVA